MSDPDIEITVGADVVEVVGASDPIEIIESDDALIQVSIPDEPSFTLAISEVGPPGEAGGGGAVDSVFGRTGAVTAQTGDYAVANITGLQTALDGKSATSHSHAISDTTGLQTALDGKQAASANLTSWSALATSAKADALHTHAISDTTGLQAALDGKQAASSNLDSWAATVPANKQDAHAILDNISDINYEQGDILYFNGTDIVALPAGTSGYFLKTMGAGANPQWAEVAGGPGGDLDDTLDAMAGVTTAADKIIYFTDVDVAAATTLTGFARGLLDDADATAGRSTLGVVIGTHVQAYSANLDSWSGLAPSAKANASHTHTISDVTNLQSTLDGKVDELADPDADRIFFWDESAGGHAWLTVGTGLTLSGTDLTLASHAHSISDTTGLQGALDGKAATTHSHAISDVTGLQTALDGKVDELADPNADRIFFWDDSASSHAWLTVGTGLTLSGTDLTLASHTHAISDTTGLQGALDGKAAASHSHAISDVTGLQTALDGKVDELADPNADRIFFWDDSASGHAWLTVGTGLTLSGTDLTLASHTHAISDTTGLQGALDGKAASSHTHAISDVTGLQTALDGKVDELSDPNADRIFFWDDSASSHAWLTVGTGLTLSGTDLTLASHSHTISDVTGLQAAIDGKQASDATLTAMAGVTTAANKIIYFTGADTAAAADLTSFGRDLIDSADADAAKTTLGLVIGTHVQAYDADLTSWAGIAPSAKQDAHARLTDISGITYAQGDILYHNGSNIVKLAAGVDGQFLKTQGASANPTWATLAGGGDLLSTNNLSDVANTTTARSNLGLAIGTNVQAYNARLADIAGITYNQGDILYYNGSAIVDLAPGTVGQSLMTGGSGANPSWGYPESFICLTSNYTLTSQTGQQKIFNAPTNGRLTVVGSTTYFFECMLHLSSMSGTSGNFTFSLIGGGTATFTSAKWIATGLDNTTPTTGAAFGGSLSTSQTGTGNITTAATGTACIVMIKGIFRINAAGTIIPSVGLTTAAAAVVNADSYFSCYPVGSNTVQSHGSWD